MTDPEEQRQARDARVDQTLADLQEAVADLVAAGEHTEPAARPVPFVPVYANVEEWVAGSFAPVFGRYNSTRTLWCPRWWDHGEAVLRLEALWRTWEAQRLDRTGLSLARWLRDYLDPQLAALGDPDGTFRACSVDEHAPPPSLPLVPAPEGYWTGSNL